MVAVTRESVLLIQPSAPVERGATKKVQLGRHALADIVSKRTPSTLLVSQGSVIKEARPIPPVKGEGAAVTPLIIVSRHAWEVICSLEMEMTTRAALMPTVVTLLHLSILLRRAATSGVNQGSF